MNEIMRFVPPSWPVRSRQGSKLFPPLGEVCPETRHLNLRWSVARLDALRLSLSDRRASIVDVAKAYRATIEEVTRLAHEMG